MRGIHITDATSPTVSRPPSSERVTQLGVTLTEMLVALTVISAIAALLLPVLSRGRAKAEEIQCMQNLRESGRGVMTMIAEAGVSWKTFAEGSPEHNQWGRKIVSSGIIKDRRVLRCPKGAFTYDIDHQAWAWQTYGLNISDLRVGILNTLPASPKEISYIFYPGRLENASRYVLMADSAANGSGQANQTFRIYHKISYRSGVYARHHGKANLFFFDGHGESVEVAKLAEKGVPYYDSAGEFQNPTTPLP